MGIKRRSDRSKRKLAALRLQVAQAQSHLKALKASIQEARSDAGLAAVRDVRAENRQLLATNLLAEQAATASQVALDLAVKASQTDPLTGLRNRSVLSGRLSHELDLASRHGHHVGVLLLDLNDFKQLNDRHGHAFGDWVLQRVANVLTATVRASDTVCRLGGDEFVVVASMPNREGVNQLVQKITEALSESVSVGGRTMTVSASVGLSVFPEDGSTEAVLVSKADASMYANKRSRSPKPI